MNLLKSKTKSLLFGHLFFKSTNIVFFISTTLYLTHNQIILTVIPVEILLILSFICIICNVYNY